MSSRTPYLFLLPSILWLMAVAIAPFVFSLYITVHDWKLLSATQTFVGLKIWLEVLSDSVTYYSIFFTILFSLIVTGIELLLGLAISLLFFEAIPGRRLMRTATLLPLAISPVVVGLSWKMLLNEDYGLVPYILRAMFIPTQAFFSGPLAPFAIVTIDVWQWTPFMILVLSAGMQTIPKEPIEAAIVDGTTYRQRLRYVLLPMLKPIIEIAVLFRLIGALKTFDIIWITTEGGPMNLTSTLSTLAYINSFIIFHVDKAAILTVLNLLLTLILTTYFLKKFFLQTG